LSPLRVDATNPDAYGRFVENGAKNANRYSEGNGQGSYLTLWLFAFSLETSGMELNGALSNPFVRGKPLDFPRLAALVEKLLAKPVTVPGAVATGKPDPSGPTVAGKRRPLHRRQGAVLASVTTVLERADQPMWLQEIHTALEQLLGEQVSRSSVREALSARAVSRDRRFRRIRRGWYERV
jgi:hypothetical protein